MKTSLLTAAAVAISFGFLPKSLSNGMAPLARADDDALSPADVQGLSNSDLETSIEQHSALIDRIKADASDRELNPREERRLCEAEESLAIFETEASRRRQPAAGRATSRSAKTATMAPRPRKLPRAVRRATASLPRHGLPYRAAADSRRPVSFSTPSS